MGRSLWTVPASGFWKFRLINRAFRFFLREEFFVSRIIFFLFNFEEEGNVVTAKWIFVLLPYSPKYRQEQKKYFLVRFLPNIPLWMIPPNVFISGIFVSAGISATAISGHRRWKTADLGSRGGYFCKRKFWKKAELKTVFFVLMKYQEKKIGVIRLVVLLILVFSVGIIGGMLFERWRFVSERTDFLWRFSEEIPLIRFETIENGILKGTLEGEEARFIVGETEEVYPVFRKVFFSVENILPLLAQIPAPEGKYFVAVNRENIFIPRWSICGSHFSQNRIFLWTKEKPFLRDLFEERSSGRMRTFLSPMRADSVFSLSESICTPTEQVLESIWNILPTMLASLGVLLSDFFWNIHRMAFCKIRW